MLNYFRVPAGLLQLESILKSKSRNPNRAINLRVQYYILYPLIFLGRFLGVSDVIKPNSLAVTKQSDFVHQQTVLKCIQFVFDHTLSASKKVHQ